MSTNVFGRISDNVNDPRQASKEVYKLYGLLFLTIFAVISGCEGWKTSEALVKHGCHG